MIEAGATATDLGVALSISDVTAAHLVKQFLPGMIPKLRVNASKKKGEGSRSIEAGMVDTMVALSATGYGIDWIGRKLGVHGTSVRLKLRQRLGNSEYMRRHPSSRYHGGPKGYAHNDRGDPVQSSYEEAVADYLHAAGVRYEMHWPLQHDGHRYYPDFYLPDLDLYVEVLGLMDLAFYRARVEVKRRVYAELGIRCIWIDKREVTPEGISLAFREVLS
jgi:hypothetical protein